MRDVGQITHTSTAKLSFKKCSASTRHRCDSCDKVESLKEASALTQRRKMSSSILFAAGLLVGAAQAYTQVNVASPFMLKNIDPIVFPGEYSKSHLHSFFGSDAVTVNTKTSAELQKGCTNAENPNDLSVYWIPTPLYTADGKNFEPIPVMRFSAYYNLGETPAEVPIPQNLRMVAGDANAQTQADMP
ncbi:hypothetical protein HZ326_23335, partial [Fusarium oxysporum f. sp. albedinis]